jgi:hypothetical protein
MNVIMRRAGTALLAASMVLGLTVSTSRAQVRLPPIATPSVVNPAFTTAPGIQIYSNLYNTALLGRAIRSIPPYAFGYNPYPTPIINSAPILNNMPYLSPTYPSVLSGYSGLGGGYPTSATLTTNPYGYDSSLTSSQYGNNGYGGYGGYGYMDPSYGFLSGSADVINANGNYWKSIQQARLMQTQADQAKIDYRRRLIDEARYERGLLPTTEELRQQELTRNLEWSRHQPPIGDITSAKALNSLLHHLNDPSVAKPGPNVPIDDEVLKRINVTSPNRTGASLGLLKDADNLQWPQALAGKDFDQARSDLGMRLQDVLQDLKGANPVKAGKVKDLNEDLQKLRNQVENSDMSPTDYIEARLYIDQIRSAIQALDDPNVVANFNHKFNAKNVAELVDGMKGWDFGPAAPGDEWAYRALHQALVAYDFGVSGQGQASTKPPASAPAPDKKE